MSESDGELKNVCVELVRGSVESAQRNVEVNLTTIDITTVGEHKEREDCIHAQLCIYVISYSAMRLGTTNCVIVLKGMECMWLLLLFPACKMGTTVDWPAATLRTVCVCTSMRTTFTCTLWSEVCFSSYRES